MTSEFAINAKDEDTKIRTSRKNKNVLMVDRNTFFNDLIKFHESRGTPIIKFPKIAGNGKLSDVDLYKLYEIVTGKGGWMKVNSKNEWSEIEKEIGFPEKCVNSELALKHIYIRFFDKYERFNFLGEEKERIDEDEEENRHKRWSARALHSIPHSYNHSHHNISDSVRANSKLSNDLYQSSEYDKLTLSLLSPLPNEQDFSINVLTLMSNECKQTLRLGKCPRLISILLAHAGIFEHFNLREMFCEFYINVRGHSQDQFWSDLLIDKPDLTDLLYEDGLTNEEVFLNDEKMKDLYGEKDKLTKEELKELSFLGLRRGMGTQDYIGQRVHQVTSIIRNLSFFDENLSILARNRTLIRFLILTANIRWNNLHMSALDVLGNIGSEIELKDPFADISSRHLFGTICDGLEGNDRAVIISCLEILSKLCQNEANEDFLLKHLNKKNYEQVCIYLLVQDMMLLIYTLECVYSLTSLGEKACNSIVDIHGVMDTLVSMITIEAQSLGPDSCIQMKVVETVPTRMLNNQSQRTLPHNIIRSDHQTATRTPTTYQSPSKFVQPSMESPSRADQLLKQNQQQLVQENEQFALAWIRNNFELSSRLMVKIEEQDMYRMYVNACTKVGRKGALTQIHFPRCVRSVFGGSVGPNPGNSDTGGSGNEKPLMYYCGIKPRATTIHQEQQSATKSEMIVIHPPKSSSPASQTFKNEESALIAQLSGKPTPTSSTAAASKTPSLLQQVLSTNQQHLTSTQSSASVSNAIVTTPTTTSSLIKSLLANKVTTASSDTNNMPTATVSMTSSCVVTTNVNSLHQVAQRQFTQKQKQLSEQLSVGGQSPSTILPSTTKLVVAGSPGGVGSLKIGSSTISIKPATVEVTKSAVVTTNDPPPLAPLSVQSNKLKSSITITNNVDAAKMLVSPSQKITANKMLVDLLDKKAPEPPVFGATTIKRKIDMDTEVPAKKVDLESVDAPVTPSPKAADLYAKLAGSILEDEEMEDEIEKSIPTKIIEKKVIEVKAGSGSQQQQIISSAPVQRQIIMGPNNQVILSPPGASHHHHHHQTTATIKTDSGIQTVPIILQNNSIQGLPGQTILNQAPPTQYILATNQQGQTYVVAQQPISQPQMPQTVLLAQTPNQQGTQTKTIIILQQNQGQQNQSSGIQQIQMTQQQGQQQKIIMTPSGQQVIYSTQRQFGQQQQQQQQPQVIQNYQQNVGGVIHTTMMPSGTTQSLTNRKIVFTNNAAAVAATGGGASGAGENVTATAGGAKIIQTTNTQQQQHSLQTITQGQNIISPSPSSIITTQSENKSNDDELLMNETTSTITTSMTTTTTASSSANNSGSSSPAPQQQKQQVSIQIPVPQSQVVGPNAQQYSIKIIPSMDPTKVKDEDVEISWPFVCDWRGCPKKKFSSANEVYLHACAVHCPSLDGTPDLFCQWGGGNSLCDNLPRKRFSLMTHIFDRHCTAEAFKMAVQKRITAVENGVTTNGSKQPYPVTLVRQPNNPQSLTPAQNENQNLLNGPTNIQNAGAAAMQAIKRHSIEFNIAKEMMEEPEGTVTKSIRLTAALILRNLVTYSNHAKRALRYHEYHLSQIALSNNESNRVIAQVLYEMNEQISPFSRP
ncbi:CLUMA_CG009087, isoform A [Clunio marinus]|uniref:CLUMA_CG009087, isoform A n=1 Tax=Clunio marinus TaxID=568069 RepID=A0A1J1I5Q8_9DIPT|nr:CLUMA_CG009087, isoform A [Clunio marinus]